MLIALPLRDAGCLRVSWRWNNHKPKQENMICKKNTQLRLATGEIPDNTILKVFDKMGNLVYVKDDFAATDMLPTNNLSQGVYLVHLYLPDGAEEVQKLIVTH